MPWSWGWNIIGLLFASLVYLTDSKDNTDKNGQLSSTLYTFQEHACSGEKLKLKCPKDTTLNIQFAQFGRQVPSHHMCPSKPGSLLPQSSQGEEDTNCLAPNSLEVVLKACQDKRHCEVEATSDAFGNDPCAGTTKYLEVAYKCRPSEFKSQLACEGQEMVLYCPKKKTRIALYSAVFGRSQGGTDECPTPSGSDQECQSTYTLDEMMKRCHGKRQCMVQATEHIFGDPCPPKMKKYLHVIYTCVPRRILKELKREPTINGHIAPEQEQQRKRPRQQQTVRIELPQDKDSLEDVQHVQPKQVQVNWETEETGSSQLNVPNINGQPSTPEFTTTTLSVDTSLHNPSGTTVPTDDVEVCNKTLSPSDRFMIGFVSDWISTYKFIVEHKEKAILYFVLGTCGGLLCLLLVIIVKIVTHRQKVKKTPPDEASEATVQTRTRSLSRPPGAHHSLLLEDQEPSSFNTDTNLSNHSDQGIEVIRYNSRVPLRTSGDSGARTLNHYYT